MAPTVRRPAAAPHHHSPAIIVDVVFCFLTFCSLSVLIMSFLDSLYPALPTYATVEYYLNYSIYAATLIGFVCQTLINRRRLRRCERAGCTAMRLGMVLDLVLLAEGSRRNAAGIDQMPWKGGAQDCPEYEWMRVGLRKIAPNNGRAVLIYFKECGCPDSKLVGEATGRRRRRNNNRNR